jgi:hypothetical protein
LGENSTNVTLADAAIHSFFGPEFGWDFEWRCEKVVVLLILCKKVHLFLFFVLSLEMINLVPGLLYKDIE